MLRALAASAGSQPQTAQAWLKTNPPELAKWLDGVTTFDGQPGLPAVKKSLGL